MEIISPHYHVEIDDADMERTHLWVTVNGVDGEMIELIEQYPVEERESAYAMARRLARPSGPAAEVTATTATERASLAGRMGLITRSSWCLQFSADL